LQKQFAEYIKDRYSPLIKNSNERNIKQVLKLLSMGFDPNTSLDSFLNEIALIICRNLGFTQGSVAVLDSKDGKYRYLATVGLRKEAKEAARKFDYTLDDLNDQNRYPRVALTRSVIFYPGELHPYIQEEEILFRRPSQVGKEREFIDQMREDDWIVSRFFNRDGKILGWLEASNTLNGKLPERENILWLECFADIVGTILIARFKY